jgi:cytosine/adenosine deaminase-related metal-dependent hydrolase
MTACMFTQMRTAMVLQRGQVNQRALDGEKDLPEIVNSRDVIRYATVEAAKGLHLDKKCGSLTPGKEADIILLDATHINAAPLNYVPGAVVTLMERANVDTVFVGGKIRKWRGSLLDVDLKKLRFELEQSRDYIFETAKVPRNLWKV